MQNMKLWYSTTSPYVRKVWALLYHHKLIDYVELIGVQSFNAEACHNQVNPLGRIPALETKDGTMLYDSRVIAEYIDDIGRQESVFPKDKIAYFQALNEQAIADGIMENAVPVFSELTLRKDRQFWFERHEQLIDRIKRSCVYLENNFEKTNALTIGSLSLTAVIDWLSLRGDVLDINLKNIAPNMAKWAAEMNKQYDCLRQTYPQT